MRDFLRYHADDAERRFAAFLSGRPVYPIQIELMPTEVCNHRCLWCVSDQYRAPGRSLEWDRLKDFLGRATERGLKEVHLCGGGEPLVYPHIEDLLRHSRKLGLRLLIYTNGSRPEPEILAEMVQSAFEVRVSIDAGDPETYSRVRRVPATAYLKTISFVQRLLELRGASKDPRIILSFVGDERNIPSVPDYVRVALALGVDQVLLKTNLLLEDETRNEHLHRMVALASEALGTWSHPRVQAYDAPKDVFASRAGQGWATAPLKAVVHSNWDVYPCCHSGGQRRFKLGNVLEDGFEGVFASARTRGLMWELVFGSGEKCVKCVESAMNERAVAFLERTRSSVQLL